MKRLLLCNSLIILSLIILYGSSRVMGQGLSMADNVLKSNDDTYWVGFALNSENNGVNVSTYISYNENMTRGLDVGYDIGLLSFNPEFELYTHLVDDNGIRFQIQCLPIDYENLIIPLGLIALEGSVINFNASDINIPDEYEIVIEDKVLNQHKILSESDEKYTIQLDENSTGIGRFFIHTTLKSALRTSDLELKKAYEVITRPIENQLLINGESTAKTIARVYSITGNLIKELELKREFSNRIPFSENAGVYIVQIIAGKKTFTKKFFWVK